VELAATLEWMVERFQLPAMQITSGAGVARLGDMAVHHFSRNHGGEACQKKSA